VSDALEPVERGGAVDERLRLVELVDRVLDRGVVIQGAVTIGVAGVDLVHLDLRLLLSGVEGLLRRAASEPGEPEADG
jgi:hypothetical protein